MARKCRNCGAPLDDGQNECEYCGATGSRLNGGGSGGATQTISEQREAITLAKGGGNGTDDKVAEYTRLMNTGKDQYENEEYFGLEKGGTGSFGMQFWDETGAAGAFGNALKILDTAEAHYWLAKAYWSADQDIYPEVSELKYSKEEKAFSHYKSAIQIAPDRAVFYYDRAMANLYYHPDQYRNTLMDLDKAIELSPNNVPFIEKRREINLEKGDTAKAEADYNRLKEISPEFARKEAEQAEREKEKAKEQAKQAAVQKAANSSNWLIFLGFIAGIVFGIFFGKAHWGILGTILFTVGMAVAGLIVSVIICGIVDGKAKKKALEDFEAGNK